MVSNATISTKHDTDWLFGEKTALDLLLLDDRAVVLSRATGEEQRDHDDVIANHPPQDGRSTPIYV
ncbi:MAG: hypothetical protein CK429_23685 [Mycobacterium sp.]|nr:MAG: hypothetical protein CK429_23685 [Mycobacterium sp.]